MVPFDLARKMASAADPPVTSEWNTTMLPLIANSCTSSSNGDRSSVPPRGEASPLATTLTSPAFVLRTIRVPAVSVAEIARLPLKKCSTSDAMVPLTGLGSPFCRMSSAVPRDSSWIAGRSARNAMTLPLLMPGWRAVSPVPKGVASVSLTTVVMAPSYSSMSPLCDHTMRPVVVRRGAKSRALLATTPSPVSAPPDP